MAKTHGMHSAMFKIKKDINNILESEDFQNAVIERQALIGNRYKQDTHIINEAIRLGAELIDVEFSVE